MKKKILSALSVLFVLACCMVPATYVFAESAGASSEAAPFPYGEKLLISLVIGLVIALIVVLVMRSGLKTVAPQRAAANYVRKGSLHITRQHEFFLYKKLEKTEKQQASSSSGNNSAGGKR